VVYITLYKVPNTLPTAHIIIFYHVFYAINVTGI